MFTKIFYTNLFIPARFAACTYGPFVFIRPSKMGDMGLLEHELVHVAQFWRNPLFGIAYLLSKKARYGYELEAYRKQLLSAPHQLFAYASHLATKYDLDVTVEQATKDLTAERD